MLLLPPAIGGDRRQPLSKGGDLDNGVWGVVDEGWDLCVMRGSPPTDVSKMREIFTATAGGDGRTRQAHARRGMASGFFAANLTGCRI